MQMNFFNGLNMSLGTLSRLSDAETRSISAENRSGAKGAGGQAPAAPDSPSRDLGTGWKCHAYDRIKPGEVFTVADIDVTENSPPWNALSATFSACRGISRAIR